MAVGEKVNSENELLAFDKDIYSLKLHEQAMSEMCWGTRVIVTKVHGGWIYQYKSREHKQNFEGFDAHIGIVFVPYTPTKNTLSDFDLI